jgi:hypothetical protein
MSNQIQITLTTEQQELLLRWLNSEINDGLGAIGTRWEHREVANGIYRQITGEDHPIMSHPQRQERQGAIARGINYNLPRTEGGKA